MNKKAIVWLVIGCSLILVGAVTFFGVLAMFKWDFKKFSTVEYITDEIEITEEYKSIKIRAFANKFSKCSFKFYLFLLRKLVYTKYTKQD